MTRIERLLTYTSIAAGAALMMRSLRHARSVDFDGQVALITGGSRGLGLLMARELGAHGARLVLVARDEAELQRAAQELRGRGCEVAVLVADIGMEADAQRVVSTVIARYGRLDVLINNAGIIKVGPLEHMTVSDFEEAMAVHFWGPFHTMRAAIPEMRAAGGGRIANISSIGGKIAVPHLAPYCASKFALAGLSASLCAELAQDNIRVTTVCPGLMRTGSPFNAQFTGQHREEFAWFTIADSLPVLSIDGRRAAAQIVEAIRHGDPELVVSWPARLATAVAAIAPNTMARSLAIANRLLPGAADARGGRSRSGWQSASAWAPSFLTRSTEKAAADNNELPQTGASHA